MPGDRRVVLVALTAQGQQTADLLLADMQKNTFPGWSTISARRTAKPSST
ncbi:MAG: hypothetical protein IPJ46_11250 [Anaerolineales bacterium]|nr:hypothetical protein [Anaerolineales bacterium]